jgi:hypothetical protein
MTKERHPMSSWCAYTSFLKEKLGRRLTQEECSVMMQLYITGVSVEDALKQLEEE